MSAKKIADGLYVGGQVHQCHCALLARGTTDSARYHKQESITQLGSLGVSRLLSLGMPPASGADAQPALEPDECLCIHLADEEDADLLSHLPLCCDFARHAASEGRSLLVACHAGATGDGNRAQRSKVADAVLTHLQVSRAPRPLPSPF